MSMPGKTDSASSRQPRTHDESWYRRCGAKTRRSRLPQEQKRNCRFSIWGEQMISRTESRYEHASMASSATGLSSMTAGTSSDSTSVLHPKSALLVVHGHILPKACHHQHERALFQAAASSSRIRRACSSGARDDLLHALRFPRRFSVRRSGPWSPFPLILAKFSSSSTHRGRHA